MTPLTPQRKTKALSARWRRKRWKQEKTPWLLQLILLVVLCNAARVEAHQESEDHRRVKRQLTADFRDTRSIELPPEGGNNAFHNNSNKSNVLSDHDYFQTPQLSSIEVLLEKYFKENLICDFFQVTWTSPSEHTSLDGLALRGCQNLTTTAELLPREASKFYNQFVDVSVIDAPRLSTVNLTGFSSLRHISLRGNRVTNLTSNTLLEALQFFELESAYALKQIEASFFSSFTPNLKTLSVRNCTALERITLDKSSFTGLLDSISNITLTDHPRLAHICPWFFRLCSNIALLDVTNCPNLEWHPSVFADRRYFPKAVTFFHQATNISCDCHFITSESANKTYYHMDFLEKLTEELKAQGTCRFRNDTVVVQDFLNDNSICAQRVLPEPSIEFSRYDPYEESNITATDLVTVSDIENSGVTTVWSTVLLTCQIDFNVKSLFWLTPNFEIFMLNNSQNFGCQPSLESVKRACLLKSGSTGDQHIQVLENGTLMISDFGMRDRGIYTCYVGGNDDIVLPSTAVIDISVDQGYRHVIYNLSLIYGFAVSGAFLLLTLLFKLIHFLLHNYGCCLFCCCCENKLPPKARRLKRAMESVEAYRSQQLDKLRENYTQQSDWIRQNCATQMERVRDNYNTQIQNLKDIRQYGTTQLTAVRVQYYEQMSKIRDYSASQLDRVHENYIFQRQRLRKFSAQNYLKVQETRLLTQRTLNKVIENMPALNLDFTTCRQGLGERQPSLEWVEQDQDQDLELDPFQVFIDRGRAFRDQSDRHSESVYFTPTGTPLREVCGPAGGAQQPLLQTNSLKNTPTREIDPYKAIYVASDRKAGHRRNRSFSQFLPPLPTWLTSSTSTGFLSGRQTIREVEVVIEHETSSNDYYGPGDDGSTTFTSISKSLRHPSDSIGKSDDVATPHKPGLSSSSDAICSSFTTDSYNQTQPLLDQDVRRVELQRRAVMNSLINLSKPDDPRHHKRLSF